MSNLSLVLYSAGGFTGNDSEDVDLTLNTLEIAAGAAGTGIVISEVSDNILFSNSPKLTGLTQGTATGEAVVFGGSGTQIAGVSQGTAAGQVVVFGGSGTQIAGVSQATAPGHVVVLDANSLIPAAFIPDLRITSVTVVADIAARNALPIGEDQGEISEGDVVVVLDDTGGDTNTATQQAYIYNLGANDSPASPSDEGYILLQSGGVISVNGNSNAVVVLTASDINYTQANPAHWTVADNSSIKATLDEVGQRLFDLEAASSGADTRTFTDSGTAIAIRQVAVIDLTTGQLTEATVTNATVARQVVITAEAFAGTNDTGLAYVRNGATIPGFAGLTPGAVYYLSTTAGDITVTPPSADAQNVYRIGTALSATELLFDPRHVVLLAV